jgi:hypothetical protein
VLVVAHCTPNINGDNKLCCNEVDEVDEVGVEEVIVYVDIIVCNAVVSPINGRNLVYGVIIELKK